MMNLFFGVFIGWRALAIVGALSLFTACAHKDHASSALQGHIGQAQTASDETSSHIRDFKSTVERVDYKASRAQKLLDQGVEQ